MNWIGIAVGFCSFLIIGFFHPAIIKGEYYWGTKMWIVFLVLGIVLTILSLGCRNFMASSILGVAAFTSFWSIFEVFEQRKRVARGWFPAGPSHKSKNK